MQTRIAHTHFFTERAKGGPVLLMGRPAITNTCLKHLRFKRVFVTQSTPTYVSVCISKLCVLPQLQYVLCTNAKLWFSRGESSKPLLHAVLLCCHEKGRLALMGVEFDHQMYFPTADSYEVICCNWGQPINPSGVTAGPQKRKIWSGSALNML